MRDSSLGESALLISEGKREWADCNELAGSNWKKKQHSSQQKYAERHLSMYNIPNLMG